ncbi:hypothetical protein T492DRAFT_629594 [Pavlovales sp. CCMP2436]|nr:hypothetical protein T492DRAFT_629594 [Pavlovales sp. CCMP2436]
MDVHGAEGVRGLKGELPMGTTEATPAQLRDILEELRKEFTPEAYDLQARNPNHFADALCRRLVGKGLPVWANNAAVRFFKTVWGGNLAGGVIRRGTTLTSELPFIMMLSD